MNDLPEGFKVVKKSDIPEGFQVVEDKPKGQSPALGQNPAVAAGSFLATLASSAGAEIASGFAGLGSLFNGGGADGAAERVEQTRNALTIPPNPQAQAGLEAVGKVGGAVEKVVRAPVAGIIGAGAALTNRSGNAGQTFTDTAGRVMDEGVGTVVGEAVAESTDSPLLGSIAATIPTAAASAVGFGAARKFANTPEAPETPAPTTVSANLDGPTLGQGIDAPAVNIDTSSIDRALNIVKKVRTGKEGKAATEVMPDRAVLESAERLGVDINPEHYSTNADFISVARALKSRTGSKLEANERAAVDALSKKADEMIDDLGGSTDKAAVSDDILSGVRSSIDELEAKANAQYQIVSDTIPAAARVDGTDLKAYIDGKLEDLGGETGLLASSEKQIAGLVKLAEKGTLTYTAIDRVRRNIGNAAFKNKGPFADDDARILKEGYALLSDIQMGVADSFGVGGAYAAGRALVTKRKGLEDSAVQAFGRDLGASLAPKIRSAANALTRGDTARITKLMNSLPENVRGRVAATLLDDLFGGGSRRGGGLSDGFAATWKALNRNQTAKNAIFEHLPEGSRQRFDDIGRVLNGIVESNVKPRANPSGSSAAIVDAFKELSGFQKVMSVGAKAGAAETATTLVGAPGTGSVAVVASFLARNKTPVIVAADEMLASPAFAKAAKAAVNGDVDGADALIQNSPSFKKWQRQLTDQERAEIASAGFMAWFSSTNNQ